MEIKRKNKIISLRIGTFYITCGWFPQSGICLFDCVLLDYDKILDMFLLLEIRILKLSFDIGFSW